ncbi:FtsX-like permease family protein [Pirellulimonas nuda]|uniref:FtsX-like permease family protein n=1 Tax=Pirellulimonas nuda TaxID=2528009 RepID=A0A518D8C4_9BACT|nr:ABC transporter permease DevC [Pirellulimonas nuda]QDU87705.1 FtsX-like permease family protein [Pirellulimonas nuda]
MNTPLAWKNLTHDKPRLVVIVAGIGFAVLLMFMQTGFENSLFDSQVQLVDALKGDLFIISRARFALAAEKRFPRDLLLRAQSVPGVEAAMPLYTEYARSVLKRVVGNHGSKGYPIRTIAVRPQDDVFKDPKITARLAELDAPKTALIDSRSKGKAYRLDLHGGTALGAQPVELASQSLRIVDTFNLGVDFVHDGNLIMATDQFERYFPARNPGGSPLGVVDIGVVRLVDGADPQSLRGTLQTLLGSSVQVLTKDDFRAKEMNYWRTNTPIGPVFLAGKLLGFIVGMVICYQIIHQDISDHLPEFATLKAIGYGDNYFLRLIVGEALLLSVFGFLPGMAVSYVLYEVLRERTGLLLQMSLTQGLLVYGLTLAMCLGSGLLAVRKLRSADPASLF